MKLPQGYFRLLALWLAVIGLTGPSRALAESAQTGPSGCVPLTLPAAKETHVTLTVVSAPLHRKGLIEMVAGRITARTADTLSDSHAVWTAGEFSTEETPYVVKITSGNAAGTCLLLSTTVANTATTLTIDSEDAAQVSLITLGVAVGDSYKLFPCDTILSLFGTPATTEVLGGDSASSADLVQLFDGSQWVKYFYKSSVARWVRDGTEEGANFVRIRPDDMILFSRRATSPLILNVLGEVPSSDRRVRVKNSGQTPLSTGWPTPSLTLADSGIASLPGWNKSTSARDADLVQILIKRVWRKYYHDGSHWRMVGRRTLSDAVPLNIGGGVILNRKNPLPGTANLTQQPPYPL